VGGGLPGSYFLELFFEVLTEESGGLGYTLEEEERTKYSRKTGKGRNVPLNHEN